MSRSLHTQPHDLRAARRLLHPNSSRRDDGLALRWTDARDAALPPTERIRIRRHRPPAGCIHPLSTRDIRTFISALGPRHCYRLRAVELRSEPALRAGRLVLAEYLAGRDLRIYAVPRGDWELPFVPAPADLAALRQYAQRVDVNAACGATVCWDLAGLRSFFAHEVLAHELGHHLLHTRGGRRRCRQARGRDHERRADMEGRRARY